MLRDAPHLHCLYYYNLHHHQDFAGSVYIKVTGRTDPLPPADERLGARGLEGHGPAIVVTVDCHPSPFLLVCFFEDISKKKERKKEKKKGSKPKPARVGEPIITDAL